MKFGKTVKEKHGVLLETVFLLFVFENGGHKHMLIDRREGIYDISKEEKNLNVES